MAYAWPVLGASYLARATWYTMEWTWEQGNVWLWNSFGFDLFLPNLTLGRVSSYLLLALIIGALVMLLRAWLHDWVRVITALIVLTMVMAFILPPTHPVMLHTSFSVIPVSAARSLQYIVLPVGLIVALFWMSGDNLLAYALALYVGMVVGCGWMLATMPPLFPDSEKVLFPAFMLPVLLVAVLFLRETEPLTEEIDAAADSTTGDHIHEPSEAAEESASPLLKEDAAESETQL